MITSFNEVIKWLELNDLEWWSVGLIRDKNIKVFDSFDNETLETRKQRFRDIMNLFPDTTFVVVAKRVKNARCYYEAAFINKIAGKEIFKDLET